MPTQTGIATAQKFSRRLGLTFGFLLMIAIKANAVGTWSSLVNAAPGGVNTMLLLSDGTVMAQNGGNTTWYKLAPDSSGSYVNGTWSTRASMHSARLYYSSQVLQDGRVFFAGAEYGLGTTNAEIYNPLSDAWTVLNVPAGLITTGNTVQPDGSNNSGFLDSGSIMLPNGNVLIFPVYPASCGRTVIFNPFSNLLSLGPSLYRGCYQDEA